MSSRFRFARSALLVAVIGSASLPAMGLDDALLQGKRFLDEGKARAAYDLLMPLEAERAGEPAYDFLLGLAALDIGQNTRAVFALERVLALEPENARARAELARAYLALGEKRAAREEFERVRQQAIPEGVAATVDRLLAMIERAERGNQPSVKGHLELGAGLDSNVNSATAFSSVAVPALGIATLNPNSVKTGDSFGTLAGGLNYRHPLGAGHVLTVGLNAAIRQNRHDTQFDTQSLDGSVGWQQARGADTFNVALAASSFDRDGQALRDTVGLNAQWQHDYDAIRQATLYAQYASITYPGQTIRDAHRLVIGAGYAQAVGPRTVAFGSAYLGGEFEKAERQPQLGHKLAGVRIGSQYRFNDQWSVLANAALEGRRYGGNEPLFLEKRSDTQIEAGVGVSYQHDKHWRFGTRLAYVDTHSTIPVYAFDRQILSLSARLDF